METDTVPSITRVLDWICISNDTKYDTIECAYYNVLGQLTIFEACGYDIESKDLRDLSRYIYDKIQELNYKNTYYSHILRPFTYKKEIKKNRDKAAREIIDKVNTIWHTYGTTVGENDELASKKSFSLKGINEDELTYNIILKDLEYFNPQLPNSIINKGISKTIDKRFRTENEIYYLHELLAGQLLACDASGFYLLETALKIVSMWLKNSRIYLLLLVLINP